MKLGVEPEQPRYRNTTVYRSAERLLSSRPRRRFAPARWLVFAVGMAAGAVAVALVVWFAMRTVTDSAETSWNGGSAGRQIRSETTSARPAPPIALKTESRAITSMLGPIDTSVSPSPAHASTFSTGELPRLPRPGRDSAAITKGRTLASRPAGPPTTLVTTLAPKTTTWVLEGEVLAEDSPSTRVRFDLYVLQPGPLSWVMGSVRLFSEKSTRQASVWLLAFLEGNIVEGRAGDFEFSLDLPDWTKEQRVVGTWSRGDKHGTLDLRRTFMLR